MNKIFNLALLPPKPFASLTEFTYTNVYFTLEAQYFYNFLKG